MFGYLRTDQEELRLREFRQYRAFYCGICREISRNCGQLPRLFLQYDCTFLAALLAFLDGTVSYRKCVCPIRCRFRNMYAVDPVPAVSYAADVNVLLGWLSARDHWTDEKKFLPGTLAALSRNAYLSACGRHPALAEGIGDSLRELAEIEKQKPAYTDEPSDAFGKLMELVVHFAPGVERNPERERILRWMFYNLGRWIYLLDAWEDRERDRKTGAYNPFSSGKLDKEDVSFLLSKSLSEAEGAYALLDFGCEHGLTDNVLYYGCREQMERVLHGTDKGAVLKA